MPCRARAPTHLGRGVLVEHRERLYRVPFSAERRRLECARQRAVAARCEVIVVLEPARAAHIGGGGGRALPPEAHDLLVATDAAAHVANGLRGVRVAGVSASARANHHVRCVSAPARLRLHVPTTAAAAATRLSTRG